jgi:TetR/AcrR family transcriptional repressor of mexJK operon
MLMTNNMDVVRMETSPELNDKALKVLRAATGVFLTHGFSAATTDMIQQAAGVSKATVYAHFANKEALFVAAIEAQCEKFEASVRAIRFEPGNIAKVLRELGHAYLNIVLSETALAFMRVIIAEASRFPQLGSTFYQAGPKAILSVVSEQLAYAADAGEIDVRATGIETAAMLFFSLLRGEGQLICLMHPETRVSPVQIDRWVETAVQTFLRAFGSETAGGRVSHTAPLNGSPI